MITKNFKLFFVIQVLSCTVGQRISVLKCDETESLQTDPQSLHPHLLEVVRIQRYELIPVCFGTLISKDFVLISNILDALSSLEKIRVRKPKVSEEKDFNFKLLGIKRLIRDEINAISISIALLELNEAIPYHDENSIFRPACLWTKTVMPSTSTYSFFKNYYWKKYTPNTTSYSIQNTNEIIFVNKIPDDECKAVLPKIYNDDEHSHLCFNSTGTTSRGNAIETKVGNRNYIVGFGLGVASHLNNISDTLIYGVSINKFIPWIESMVWPEGNELMCGQRKVKHKPLVSFAQPTYHGEYPWHVALYRVESGRQNSQTYICGGTIINNQTILTAAHCLQNEVGILSPNRLLITAGTHDLTRFTIDSQNYIGQNIIVHEEYNRNYMENDIAIIKLSSTIEFSHFIQPICLSNNPDFDNITMGTVAGWGHNEHDQPSDVLLQATFPIRSNTECRQSNRDFFHTYLNDNNYCAGYENGTNVCAGDSGGGMIFQYGSQWFIRGLVSTGVPVPGTARCDVTQLVLFTDVLKFYRWIVNNL